jgi:hypothetical protein
LLLDRAGFAALGTAMMSMVVMLAAVLFVPSGPCEPAERDDPAEQRAAEPTKHNAT